MQKIFLLLLFLSFTVFLTAQTTSSVSVFFELDQHTLSPEARRTLDTLAAGLLDAPDYSVTIDAYTDDRGTEKYNLRLAADRAEAVQHYLSAKGLLPGKTSVKNWGEQNRADENTTETVRQKNRRVDISATLFRFDNLSALKKQLSATAEQTISMQPDQEQQITAAGGTVVVIPAQSFVFEDGTAPDGPVEVIIKEAYSTSDWIAQNLHTMSDGRLLQTGGMVYIDAQSDGKPLVLAAGASLTVAMPARQVDPGMELFYSRPDAGGNINWQPAGQAFRRTLKNPQVTLDIDPSLSARIMALRAPIPAKPVAPVFAADVRPEPREPNAPRPPYPPRKPEWDHIQNMFGGGMGAAMSRKNNKKAQKYYREALAKYERDSVNHIGLYEKYLNKVANYEVAKNRFAADYQNWEQEVKSRIFKVMDFEREQYLFTYSNGLQRAIKQVGKNIGQYQNYSNLEYAVHIAAETNYRMRLREDFISQNRDRVVISDLYSKCIGYKVVNGSAFRGLYLDVKDTYPRDTLQRAISGILKTIGIKQISDSLKSELAEKRLLTAQSPGDAGRYLNAYVADVAQLGWINCDKFYNDPSEKVQLVVNEAEDASMYVVCKEINSVLSCSPNGRGAYAASGIPKGKKVSVIAIKLKDGKAQFAMQDVKAGETGALQMNYRSLSMKELKEELRNL